jgi:hypothetical protein
VVISVLLAPHGSSRVEASKGVEDEPILSCGPSHDILS